MRILVLGLVGSLLLLRTLIYMRNNGSSIIPMAVITALVLLVVYGIKAVVMVIPAPALYMAAGAAFPVEWALLVTYMGLFISLSIGYYTGKHLGEDAINALLAKNKRVSTFLELQHKNLPSFCFIARILPLPKDPMSMFFGSIKMPFSRYLIISMLGMSPIMIPNVIAGHAISQPLSPEFLVPFGVSLVITVSVFSIYNIHIKKPESPDSYVSKVM